MFDVLYLFENVGILVFLYMEVYIYFVFIFIYDDIYIGIKFW